MIRIIVSTIALFIAPIFANPRLLEFQIQGTIQSGIIAGQDLRSDHTTKLNEEIQSLEHYRTLGILSPRPGIMFHLNNRSYKIGIRVLEVGRRLFIARDNKHVRSYIAQQDIGVAPYNKQLDRYRIAYDACTDTFTIARIAPQAS